MLEKSERKKDLKKRKRITNDEQTMERVGG